MAAAILGAAGVALGAFGAHALKATLEASGRTDTWETAVFYHLVHALALLVLSTAFDAKVYFLLFCGWGRGVFRQPLPAVPEWPQLAGCHHTHWGHLSDCRMA